jgi:hypothetical protein
MKQGQITGHTTLLLWYFSSSFKKEGKKMFLSFLFGTIDKEIVSLMSSNTRLFKIKNNIQVISW